MSTIISPNDPAATAPPLLDVESIDVVLGRGWRASKILSDVSLRIWPGEIVGLVGETGSGKTTLARRARRAERRGGRVQFVFQDPLRSLDPELTVDRIIGEGLAIRNADPGEIASGSPRPWPG